MVELFRSLLSWPSGKAVRSFIFFVLFYLYLWLDVDLRLIYHGGGVVTNFPVFYRGWEFFADFLAYPGGPVEYAAAFLSQFFYYSWSGAVVLTAVAWLICECSGFFFRTVNASRLAWVRFVGPLLLLIIYSRYAFHFVTTAAMLTALVFVCLYLKITPKSRSAAVAVFLFMSAVLYYLAGGSYMLFAVLCVIYELLFVRRWRLSLVYLLSAAVVPYIAGVGIFGMTVVNAFSKSMPFDWETINYAAHRRLTTIIYVLYLFLPLAALGLGLWRLFIKSKFKKAPVRVPWYAVWLYSLYSAGSGCKWLIDSFVLFVLAGIVVFFSHHVEVKTAFAVDYYSCHRKWPQILTVAHRYPSNDYFVAHAVNRALYHTGRLGIDMFSYPQHPDALLLSAESHKDAYWKRFDTYIDLGFMNLAEYELFEALEKHGDQPVLLKRLALVNMVKGNIDAARIYLGALNKTLFGSEWAAHYLEKLDTDPNLSEDKYIQHLRSLRIKTDYGTDFPYETEDICLDLLEANRQNRMAFEYLMALYLLTRQLDKFVQNLDRLDDFDYPDIPRLYEEAILLYTYRTGKAVELYGLRISPESFQRFEGFKWVLSYYRGDERAALEELAKHFSDGYFFYYTCVYLGLNK